MSIQVRLVFRCRRAMKTTQSWLVSRDVGCPSSSTKVTTRANSDFWKVICGTAFGATEAGKPNIGTL